MCGRFLRHAPAKLIATLFDCLPSTVPPPLNYNVAPTQAVLVVPAMGNSRQLGSYTLGTDSVLATPMTKAEFGVRSPMNASAAVLSYCAAILLVCCSESCPA